MIGCMYFVHSAIGYGGWCKAGASDGTGSRFKQTGVFSDYAKQYCRTDNYCNCEYAYRNGVCDCGTPISRRGECHNCDGTLHKYR